MLPALILLIAAAVLFVLGASPLAGARKLSPIIALVALVAGAFAAMVSDPGATGTSIAFDSLGKYVSEVATLSAILFVLLAWPSAQDGSSNRSISFGTETGEYFALLLVAVAGICVTASSRSLGTLFLGFEMASIPTYIMVTMSRPQESAQEAGVKYFFLGAASSAILLLGVAYLFGATGEVQFDKLIVAVKPMLEGGGVPTMITLGTVLMLLGLSFKLAAVPLHFYAGDVYQGAATPVTAAISFIPKITALFAIVKVLHVVGGGTWTFDPKVLRLLWIMAVLTMTVGNVLALWQFNVKRTLAYSSVAHSGYLLVGVAAVAMAKDAAIRSDALASVAFYITAYGLMNVAAFGVLQLLPARTDAPANTAETYDDIAGTALTFPGLGLAMTIACLSLIGIPATVGFLGKFFILPPAMQSGNTMLLWLAIFTMVNAAISAAYYLKIAIAMWTPSEHEAPLYPVPAERSLPIRAAVTLSTVAVLILGIVLPMAGHLFAKSAEAANALLGQ
jgi:NADH-quinone oxidoreductase subunit N